MKVTAVRNKKNIKNTGKSCFLKIAMVGKTEAIH
jgi:hypothetical protein